MTKFTIPIKLETNNALLRMHWAKRRRYQRGIKEQIWTTIPFRCNNGAPRSKKIVKILYLTKRRQDPDNFVASLKFLIDAMVELELLKDDSPECMALHAEQRKAPKEAYQVRVEIL